MGIISNNILALLLVVAMLVSVLGTISAMQNLEYVMQNLGTGKLTEGKVKICISRSPVITSIGDQNVTQNDGYYYQVNDTMSHGTEIVRFFDNATFFVINRTKGLINFTATNAMVGQYWIRIWANESMCGMEDFEIVNFTVFNVNDAPQLLPDPIPPQNLSEDILYEYDVNVTDPDLYIPQGETITFGDNTSLFEINATTGLISFIPVEDDIGIHHILIWVEDGEYMDSQTVVFNISFVNDPPILGHIGTQTAVEDHTYFFDVNATDEENDTLTFHDNATFFDIEPVTGFINFTPNITQKNNYTINISVTDGHGWDWEIVYFSIVGRNHKPNITYWFPNENRTENAKEISENFTTIWFYKSGGEKFMVNATDPDGTIPSFLWFMNNESLEDYDDTHDFFFPESGKYIITAYATDGLLNDSHTWIALVIPQFAPPSPPGGGGGGRPVCRENWRCTTWSICSKEGIQIRDCIDLNDCGTYFIKPDENRSCTYTPYPSCFDGIKNCHGGQCEILADCGGPCDPCPTCDDSIRNHGEEGVDCGGPCPPCPEKCIKVTTFAIDMETGECRAFSGPCDIPEGWKLVDRCPPIQPVVLFLYVMILALLVTLIILVWLQRKKIKDYMRRLFAMEITPSEKEEKEKQKKENIGKEALEVLRKIKDEEKAGRQKKEGKDDRSG